MQMLTNSFQISLLFFLQLFSTTFYDQINTKNIRYFINLFNKQIFNSMFKTIMNKTTNH